MAAFWFYVKILTLYEKQDLKQFIVASSGKNNEELQQKNNTVFKLHQLQNIYIEMMLTIWKSQDYKDKISKSERFVWW